MNCKWVDRSAGSDDICDWNRINIHGLTCASFALCLVSLLILHCSLWIPLGQEMEDTRRGLISRKEEEEEENMEEEEKMEEEEDTYKRARR